MNVNLAILFPFPISSLTQYRIGIRRGYDEDRYVKRYGNRHIFAFQGGTDDKFSDEERHHTLYRRAFESLGEARNEVESTISNLVNTKSDEGFHSLVLKDTNLGNIKFQSYEDWLPRLTREQHKFVFFNGSSPQRVEGPAGTGKTLSLILRAQLLCRRANESQDELRILFVAHSEPTRQSIEQVFDTLDDNGYHRLDRNMSNQSIELSTLQQWCGDFLGAKDISTAQYLDQDAFEAKSQRKALLSEVLGKRMTGDHGSVEYLSPECRAFFENENKEYVSELLQHEIGVLIKGRAEEDLEAYLNLPPLSYCLPAKTEEDRRFVFSIFTAYQSELDQFNVYDTDDIVLSSLGRLNTPIWRRRRSTEGYDVVLIDETHLFNLNELSVFHHILKRSDRPTIIFSIDVSQAIGERGITSKLVNEVLTDNFENEVKTRTEVVFRSSPEIVRLAEAITNAGATLFTTFDNPLINASSIIVASDEQLAQKPIYWTCENDRAMCSFALRRAEDLSNELKCPISEILIVAVNEQLIELTASELETSSKSFVRITQRGDLETVKKGAESKSIILSHPDYVGGLEFKAVLVVGVDEGRFPSTDGIQMTESKHFAVFKACNRLYVVITRARLRAEIFCSKERGPSTILDGALDSEAIEPRVADPS